MKIVSPNTARITLESSNSKKEIYGVSLKGKRFTLTYDKRTKKCRLRPGQTRPDRATILACFDYKFKKGIYKTSINGSQRKKR